MQPAVTFDFHNTLIRCDAWFDMEVKKLPFEVARRLHSAGNWPSSHPGEPALTAAYRALRTEIIEHGQELDSSEGVLETFRRVGVTVRRELITPIIDHLFAALVEQSSVVDGARESLAHLRDQGIRIGVVSSAVHHDFLESALQHHHLHHFLEEIVTSASSGFYKSRPEIYEVAFASLRAPLAQSVHVGDSFRFDHLAGMKAGLQTVWLNETGEDLPANQPEPTLTLNTLVGAGPRIHALLASPIHAR
jgi:FMN phosphatase YigB (HAD superfamily)